MFGSARQFKFYTDQYFEGKDAVANYLIGMKELSVPKIFYCEWLPENTPEERKAKQDIMKHRPHCCFNHTVGMPTIKFEFSDDDEAANERLEHPVEFMGFNKRMLDKYHNHKRISQNKCRGSGSSEMFTVRWMCFKYAVMNKIPNHKCIITAGTRLKSTLEFSIRAKELLDKIPQVYDTIPSSDSPTEMKFKTGGRMLYFPASPSAIRGQENVGDIVLEECAHWNLKDDVEVYRASEFVYTKTKCHILHLTTPRGKRGFYYDKVWDPESMTKYHKHTINWREITGLPVRRVEELYDRPFNSPDDILEVRRECIEQYRTDPEYRNWFDSYFGGLTLKQVIDVPNIILDINHIIEQSETNPNDYDQELDNQFIASENRAIGEFVEEEFDPIDLREQITKFNINDFRDDV